MVAETWLYNPWVVAIGSGILLILFEEIISAYKEKKVYHRPRWQRTEVRCFLFYKTNLSCERVVILWVCLVRPLYPFDYFLSKFII